jgi:hypothetical protein
MNASKRSMTEMLKVLNALANSSEKMTDIAEKQAKALDDVTKATQESAKATKDADSELKKYKKNLDDVGDDLDDVYRKMDKYYKEAAKFGKMSGFKATIKVAGFDKIEKDLYCYVDELHEAQRELEHFQSMGVTGNQFENAQRSVRDLSLKIRDLEKELDTTNDKFVDFLKDPTPARAVGNIEEGITGIGSAFGALSRSPKDFADHMKGARESADKLKNGSAILGKMPGLLGVAGKAAKGLAGVFGGITKVLAGWPGLIAMAVVQMAKAATNIDSYIKQTNRRFAEIRGPEIMTTDLKKQFNDFNRAVFNSAKNIRDGLVPEQVYEFMSAIGTTGQRLSTLNEGFYNYRDAVHVAAKASKVFGLDLATVGGMMGKFTTDFRMSLDSMDDAFKQMSFDAEKSGLSTDRFLTAVQNASVGLSFYGTFIKTASKVMADFSKTQVMGADDAAQATQDLVQSFSKMDTKEAMALIQLTNRGQKAFKETFANLRKESAKKAYELGEQAVDVEAQLRMPVSKEKKDELAKKLEQLRTEQKKQMEISERLQSASNGDIVAMAQNIGSLSDSAPKDILKLISSITRYGDISKLQGEDLEIAMRGVEKVTGGKINQKLVQKLIAQTRANGMTLDIALGVADKNLSQVAGLRSDAKKDDKGLLGYLKKINKSIIRDDKGNIKNLAELQEMGDSLTNPLKSLSDNSDQAAKEDVAGKLATLLGMTKDETLDIATGVAINKDFKKNLINLINEVTSGKIAPEKMVGLLNSIKKDSGVTTSIQENAFTADKVANKEIQSAYDATFKGIRDQTLSIEDMLTIAKSEIEYRVKSLGFLQDISYGITKMAAKVSDNVIDMGKMAKATEGLEKNFGVKLGKGKTEVSTKTGKFSTYDYVKTLMRNNRVIAGSIDDANKNLDLISTLERKPNPTKEDKQQLDRLNKQKALFEKTVNEGAQNIQQNNAILGQLQESGAADQDMIDLLSAQLAGNKESQKALVDIAKRKFPGMTKVSLEQLKSVKNIGPALADAAMAAGRVEVPGAGTGTEALIKAGVMKGSTKGAMVNLDDIPSKQGLANPEQVTKAGAVLLHPGESILPKSDFKTSKIMEPEKGGKAPPVEKSITINVNATEKDLAQKIANEIRGFFYREHVNNLG